MIRLPKFSSPMVIRPKAKQRIYMLLALPLFLIMQVWVFALSFDDLYIPGILSSPVLVVLMLWHTYQFLLKAEGDVTAFLPSAIAVSAAQIVLRIFSFVYDHLFLLTEEGLRLPLKVSDVLLLGAECLYWIFLAYAIIKAVCGQYKLVVPLLALFFGFFYTFIEYDLRSFAHIAAEVCLLLLLWFPIDAVAFTSLYTQEKD